LLAWTRNIALVVIALAVVASAWALNLLASQGSGLAANGQELVKQSVAAIRDALTASSRAWAGPENARIRAPVAAGSPVIVEMTIHNTGQEPAQDFSWSQQRFVSAANEASAKDLNAQITADVKKCMASAPVAGQGVLFASTGAGIVLATTFEGSVIDADVIKGTKLLFVETCLSYTSAAKPRHSAFCYFYNAIYSNPQNLNLCQLGNSAD